jgi:hypothetical protein
MLSIISQLSRLGTYAIALAVFGIIALSVVAALKNSLVWLFAGRAAIFVMSLTQYLSGKFMNAGDGLIRSRKNLEVAVDLRIQFGARPPVGVLNIGV